MPRWQIRRRRRQSGGELIVDGDAREQDLGRGGRERVPAFVNCGSVKAFTPVIPDEVTNMTAGQGTTCRVAPTGQAWAIAPTY